MERIPYLRVFVSSPSDIIEERRIALDVIENLPNQPVFRKRVSLQIIAWDKPGAGTAMRAKLTPQEAINKGLPKPSECDIVVVLFWSRMGTRLRIDGEEFLSGTHWELLDALNSDRPKVRIYHRTEDPAIKPSDLERNEKLAQYDLVKAFFKSDLFYDPETGSIRRGVNNYTTPEEFRQHFEQHFQEAVLEALEKLEAETKLEEDRRLDAAMPKQVTLGETTELWVQICLPHSIGFKKGLPVVVEGGEEITSQDVEEDKFTLTFPVNPLTGETEHIRLAITAKADDFSLDNKRQTLRIHAGKDSGKVIFHLTAIKVKIKSRIRVQAHQIGNGGELDMLGSVSLRTHISDNKSGSHIGWNMVSLPLSPLTPVALNEEYTPESLPLSKPKTENLRATQTMPKTSPQWLMWLNVISAVMIVFAIIVVTGAGGSVGSLVGTAGSTGSNGSDTTSSSASSDVPILLIIIGALAIAAVVAINLYYLRGDRKQ